MSGASGATDLAVGAAMGVQEAEAAGNALDDEL
jgi:hypothetical protein